MDFLKLLKIKMFPFLNKRRFLPTLVFLGVGVILALVDAQTLEEDLTLTHREKLGLDKVYFFGTIFSEFF